MSVQPRPDRLEVLRAYSAGLIGTRATIERAGTHGYADLVIVLARNELDFTKPAATPAHEVRVAVARRILQPRLRHGD